MSDARGYSYTLVKAVNAADPKLLGVRLGKVCIERNIPATKVATDVGVTKQTVYSWFTGTFKPRGVHVETLEKILAELEEARV